MRTMCPSQRIHPHHNRSSAGCDNEARVSTLQRQMTSPLHQPEFRRGRGSQGRPQRRTCPHRRLHSRSHRSEGCEARSSMPCTHEHARMGCVSVKRGSWVAGPSDSWSRGFDVAFTWRRSPVQIWPSPFSKYINCDFPRILMGNGGPTGHPCHRCDRTPVDMGLRANFLECFCGPCCPEHGFRCKHDFEWVCVDCQNDCWRGDIRRCPPSD